VKPPRAEQRRPRSGRTVEPQLWSPRGEAVAPRHGGTLETFVFGGIPGEKAHVHVKGKGEHRVYARFDRPADRPHRDRRDPPCGRFYRCGGCPLMHLVPDAQLAVKRRILLDAFEGAGVPLPHDVAVVPSPSGNADFRHVMKLGVGRSQEGSLQVGGFARGNREVLPIPRCLVITPVLREAMKTIAHQIIERNVLPYYEKGGLLRYVIARQSRATGKVQVVLVARQRDARVAELALGIEAANSAIVGIHVHVNREDGNALFDADEEGLVRTQLLAGAPTMEEQLAGIRFVLGPTDFFQTNPAVAELLVQEVLALTADDRDRPIVDLYAGIGALTRPRARQHGWAVGVERSQGSVLHARQSAALNGIDAEFLAMDSDRGIETVGKRLAGRPPVVVVDPARRGLERGMGPGILSLRPARIVYVSCNPRALADDVREFEARGYKLDALRAFDMFPETPHLEVVARLSPVDAPPAAGRAPRRRVARST
jgi:23S rRNA (uracil1939-C5)-methyltransferase